MTQQTVFTVAEYADSIKERPIANVEKDRKFGRKMNSFENRQQAVMFVLYRANERVAAAKKHLRNQLAAQRKAQKLAEQVER